MTALAIVGLLVSGYLLDRGNLDIPILRAAATFCVALFFLCLFLHQRALSPPARAAPSHVVLLSRRGRRRLGAVLVGIVAPLVLPGNYDFAIGLLLAAVLGLVVAWPSGRVMRGVWAALLAGGIALIATRVHSDSDAIVRVRNFYGTVHVTHADEPQKATVRSLLPRRHHARSPGLSRRLRRVPSTYYARTSGMGLALDQCCRNRSRRIGVDWTRHRNHRGLRQHG